MFCVILGLLTSCRLEAHFEKVRKCEKQNVNGAEDVQYVSWKFLTGAGFYSILWLRKKKPVGGKHIAVEK